MTSALCLTPSFSSIAQKPEITGISLRNRTLDQDEANFQIKADYPELQNFKKQKIQKKFNDYLQNEISQRIVDFRKHVEAWGKESLSRLPEGMKSSLYLTYTVVQDNPELISLLFDANTYYAGAAHPNSIYFSVNFDLKKGKLIELQDLFKKKSNFLQILSDYAIRELMKRRKDISSESGWIQKGAGPDPKNYDIFNLTPRGLMIHFNPYQVAPYVAGPQRVFISFDQLKPILKSNLNFAM